MFFNEQNDLFFLPKVIIILFDKNFKKNFNHKIISKRLKSLTKVLINFIIITATALK